jgi:CubicO group peptidase (beta-lactamase class C family)
MTRAETVTRVLQTALRTGAFTAVAAEVGSAREVLWTWADGYVTDDPSSATVTGTTMFDLASLTKVLVTTTLATEHVASDRLRLDCPLTAVVADWKRSDRVGVTVRDCLEHCTGLPAHRPYFQTISGRVAYQHAISREPLEYAPRTRELYSDLDFILLGFIIEDVGGAPLAEQFDQWKRMSRLRQESTFVPTDAVRSRVAGTGYDSWRGRRLQGDVHDQNAAALDGVAGHAGLFGTAAAVGEIARWWMAHVPELASFVRRSAVPNSSRALGWDTMLPTSSCGTRLSRRAFGHTGFTGTSLWIDPEADLYAALLTNFVQSSRDRSVIRDLRRAFHDAVMIDLQR